MTYEEFIKAIDTDDAPPPDLSPQQKSVWLAVRGNWAAAHELVQPLEDPLACWIHAHLHREEGDAGNARYWYGRAGEEPRSASLDEERDELARALFEG